MVGIGVPHPPLMGGWSCETTWSSGCPKIPVAEEVLPSGPSMITTTNTEQHSFTRTGPLDNSPSPSSNMITENFLVDLLAVAEYHTNTIRSEVGGGVATCQTISTYRGACAPDHTVRLLEKTLHQAYLISHCHSLFSA